MRKKFAALPLEKFSRNQCKLQICNCSIKRVSQIFFGDFKNRCLFKLCIRIFSPDEGLRITLPLMMFFFQKASYVCISRSSYLLKIELFGAQFSGSCQMHLAVQPCLAFPVIIFKLHQLRVLLLFCNLSICSGITWLQDVYTNKFNSAEPLPTPITPEEVVLTSADSNPSECKAEEHKKSKLEVGKRIIIVQWFCMRMSLFFFPR